MIDWKLILSTVLKDSGESVRLTLNIKKKKYSTDTSTPPKAQADTETRKQRGGYMDWYD